MELGSLDLYDDDSTGQPSPTSPGGGAPTTIELMPTPFTHLEIAQRLLADEDLAQAERDLLRTHQPAFLLGSVAADARVAQGGREATHFYEYDAPLHEHPWRTMVQQHPTLMQPHSPAQRVFVAGYVAHLAVDEAWVLRMLRPYFVYGDWGGVSRPDRFVALHLILTHMDERDYDHLSEHCGAVMRQAAVAAWLPFMPDEVLRDWRDFIASQVAPGGQSRTLEIFAPRVRLSPEQMRAMLDTQPTMQRYLWQHVPQSALAEVERQMYAFAREQMQIYLAESVPSDER